MLKLILNAVQSLQSASSTSEHAPNKISGQEEEKVSAHQNVASDSPGNRTPPHSALPRGGFSGQVLGDVELIDSIDRLRKLVDRQGCTVMAESVEDVIDDLQAVLKAAQDLSRQTLSFRSLKRSRGSVASAKSLSINELGELNFESLICFQCIFPCLEANVYLTQRADRSLVASLNRTVPGRSMIPETGPLDFAEKGDESPTLTHEKMDDKTWSSPSTNYSISLPSGRAKC